MYLHHRTCSFSIHLYRDKAFFNLVNHLLSVYLFIYSVPVLQPVVTDLPLLTKFTARFSARFPGSYQLQTFLSGRLIIFHLFPVNLLLPVTSGNRWLAGCLRERILSLSAASTRKWGKMDLQQMLVHCTAQLKLAVGEMTSQMQGPALMRTGLGKWILFSVLPWPKGSMTPIEMKAEANRSLITDIDTGKGILLSYLEKTRNLESLKPHPFFGSLNRDEWARLIYKHLDHHLKQFGC
jgi:Protein of unknown function (DUF1569)